MEAGQIIGLIDDNLVTAGDDIASVATTLLAKANIDRHERITVYFGSDSSQREAEKLAKHLQKLHPKLEFEIVDGGQALYPYIISVE